ncbi:MAG TPA: hypothetical protein PLJ60_09885 [Chryseolinea sp.]|nr:hypothetical protein [Chryseolinea sp.]
MIYRFVFLFLVPIASYSQVPKENNPKDHPYQINKWFVEKLNNNPISYYLNNPDIDNYSKMYYKGEFAASDDSLTFGFLDSLLTSNRNTRDFYLFVFNSVLRISDGALAESMGSYCRAYFEKYPCDFLGLRNDKFYADNYQRWIDFAAYEYLFEKDPIKTIENELKILHPIVSVNCNERGEELDKVKSRIIDLIE